MNKVTTRKKDKVSALKRKISSLPGNEAFILGIQQGGPASYHHNWEQNPFLETLSRSRRDVTTLDYYKRPPYVSAYPSNKSVATEISRLPFAETFFDLYKPVGRSGRGSIVRPEQEPFHMMCHIIRKFSSQGPMVWDPCFGSVADRDACQRDTKHRECTGCESDSQCVAKVASSLKSISGSTTKQRLRHQCRRWSTLRSRGIPRGRPKWNKWS